MSQSVGFFTPVEYSPQIKENSLSKRFFLFAENYFPFSGKTAFVFRRKKNGEEMVCFNESKRPILQTIFKIITYITVVLPILLLIVKAIYRSKHRFCVLDPQKKLEKHITISHEIQEELKNTLPSIEGQSSPSNVVVLAKANTLVFQLTNAPKLVFKMLSSGRISGSMEQRFQKMVYGVKVCQENGLKQLVIPHARLITITCQNHISYTLIVEEKLEFEPKEESQELLYQSNEHLLQETIRQLAVFIAKTGFNDVTWRNIPLLEERTSRQDRKIGLIDIENMENAEAGFSGSINRSRGLIRCLPQSLIPIAIQVATTYGLASQRIRKAEQQRNEEINAHQQLQIFYQKKHIQTGTELLDVNLDELGLDLNLSGTVQVYDLQKLQQEPPTEQPDIDQYIKMETITLRDLANRVIDKINELIASSKEQSSLRHRRQISLSVSYPPLSFFASLGRDPEDMKNTAYQNTWIYRILQALISKGHLFGIIQETASEYLIQA